MTNITEKLVGVDIIPEEEAVFCDYVGKCSQICFQKDAEHCSQRKYYDENGSDYIEEMFIGSKL